MAIRTTTIMITAAITTIMTDAQSLYRLTAWTSPAFPTGAFSYSHGLEWAVEAGRVTSEAELEDWIAHGLAHGVGLVDGALMAAGYRAAFDESRLSELIDLACAWRATSEMALESAQTGAAFLATLRSAWPSPALDRFASLCGERQPGLALTFGVAAAETAPLDLALRFQLASWTSHQISAGVRLIPLGQTAGQRLTAKLETAVLRAAEAAEQADLDEIGGAAWIVDIASMRHETQTTRLFRS
jgi:urease accessory protein